MAFLVIVGIVVLLGIIITIVEKFDKAKRFDQQVAKFGELEKFQAETEQKRIDSEKEIQFLREKLSQQLSRDKESVLVIAKEKAIGFPWLAKAYDEYFELSDLETENYLRYKKHPAVKEAQRFKDASAAKRQALAQNRILRFQLAYYEELFPWLTDYRDIEIGDASIRVQPTDESDAGEERDPAEYWLSASEYKSLPTTEKYQMALDRYWNTKKSPWEVGRLYERYVGYLYEQEGFSVSYHGILEGYDDMGRDLICKKPGMVLIVQCKCWARVKIIHEKHINQLYGTTAKYLLELQEQVGTTDLFNDHKVFAHFITSASLSPRADKFAKALKIHVKAQLSLAPFPCIKCNIANDGERIYHLPFDQQYDRTIVHTDRGEFYAQTIAEAEQKGFRRAWRWRGAKQSGL